MPDIVQIRNLRSDRYIKIDREHGAIIEHKQTPGPYKGIPIVENAGTKLSTANVKTVVKLRQRKQHHSR